MSNFASQVSPNMPTFSPMYEIHVLVVEHDGEDNDKTKSLLERFSYKVTTVSLAAIALSILSKGKMLFDLVIIDTNSCHSSDVSRLLQQTVNLNLLVILMCKEVNVDTTLWALDNGAFLSVKKPMSTEIMECLWQHVVRDKLGKLKEREEAREGEDFSVQEKEFVDDVKEDVDNDKEEYYDANPNSGTMQHDNPMFMRRKVWTEWTQELHEKFMDAVVQLGEGRCYPKEILELMNIPGLTRMQVASHLQKCRNEKWLPPNKRKSKLANMEKPVHLKNKAPRSKTLRFGSMPRRDYNYDSDFNSSMQECHGNQQEFSIGQQPEMNTNNVRDNINEESFDSLYYSQLLVDHANHDPFAKPNETFNMAPLGHGFGYDQPLMYGAQSLDSSTNSSMNQRDHLVEDAFGFSYKDSEVQNLPPSLGVDYNYGMHSTPNQNLVQYNEMPLGMRNATGNYNWGWEVHNEW